MHLSAASSASPAFIPPRPLLRRSSRAAAPAATVPVWRLYDSGDENATKDPEEMIVLLLGSGSSRVPSHEHLQMEMFMLTKADTRLDGMFRFEPRRRGPHSSRLRDALLGPLRRTGEYEVDSSGRASLTAAGQKAYDKMVLEDGGLRNLVDTASLVRHIYDEMDADEFSFLIGDAYPEAVEPPNARGGHTDPETRKRMAESLIEKGFITMARYRELIGG